MVWHSFVLRNLVKLNNLFTTLQVFIEKNAV